MLRRTEDLFLDWFASALAGKGARPVETLARFWLAQGPADGASEVLIHRRGSSPLVAAAINAAASHFAEQDDVHNGSVFHPAAVVFPAALAVAQALGRSGRELLVASVAGYEVGIRVGEFLGRSHYKVFHTTGTAGSVAAAAAVGRLLELTPQTMLHAFGSAGTQAAGLWEFLRDAADSKQLHTAHAASTGLAAAYLARRRPDRRAAHPRRPAGHGRGHVQRRRRHALVDGLGTRWATAETSFKYHASCRHTHPAADALLQVLRTHGLRHRRRRARDRRSCTRARSTCWARSPTRRPCTRPSSRWARCWPSPRCTATPASASSTPTTAPRVCRPCATGCTMVLDAEVDAAYPARWIGKVEVLTKDGRVLHGRVDEPKGDPGNTLSRPELEAKALKLAAYRGGASEAEMRGVIERVWALDGAVPLARGCWRL